MSVSATDKPAILVVGLGPFPPELEDRLHLPGIRAWEIARTLALKGHSVCLLGLYVNSDAIDEWRRFDLTETHSSVTSPAVKLTANEKGAITESELARHLAILIESRRISAAVGVMESVTRHLAQMRTTIPIWMDFPGDPMAERQLLSAKWNSDTRITEMWAQYSRSLTRGDKFSGCSRHQVGALLGELGAVGRLNRHTTYENLAAHVPLGPIQHAEPEPGRIMRGKIIPQDALVVFQSGGFNNWLDIETLLRGLELAMEREPKLHFAASGGSLGVHNNESFEL